MKSLQNQMAIGSWLTTRRLEELHAEFDDELQQALREKPQDNTKISQIKKSKLLCKDLLEARRNPPKLPATALEGRPSAKIHQFRRRESPQKPDFFDDSFDLAANG